jgi:FAD:protein FMN transferase
MQFNALGTNWEILLQVNQSIEEELLKTVYEFERLYSRFDNNSLVSQLNNNRVINNANAELIDMIKISQKWFKISNCKFNILVGDYLEKSGYNQQLTFSDYEIKSAQIGNPITDIIIDNSTILLKGNSRLDLGGVGKGYLIDKLKNILLNHRIQDFIINGGGDIISYSLEPKKFYLRHPFIHDEYIQEVMLHNQALCSSSSIVRAWQTMEGAKYNHLINHDNTIIQSYVIASDSLTADIVATTVCLGCDNIQFENITIYEVKQDQELGIVLNQKVY